MRNCPNCGHQFDDPNESPPNCPSCGREFTVSNIGAATIDFGPGGLLEPVPRSAPTVVESAPGKPLLPPAAVAASSTPADPGGGTVGDQTAMTLQSGRWSPSAEDLADPASARDMHRTTLFGNEAVQ